MRDLLFGPNGIPKRSRHPETNALQERLRRHLWKASDCRCSQAWLKLEIEGPENPLPLGVRACCKEREGATLARLIGNEDRLFGTPLESVRVLLSDCRNPRGFLPGDSTISGSCELSILGSAEADASVLMRCEPDADLGGVRTRTLLVRSLYTGPNIEEAIRRCQDVQVVAYWRRGGIDWTPRSIRCAKRFGLGIGGSFTAKLTRLISASEIWAGAAGLDEIPDSSA